MPMVLVHGLHEEQGRVRAKRGWIGRGGCSFPVFTWKMRLSSPCPGCLSVIQALLGEVPGWAVADDTARAQGGQACSSVEKTAAPSVTVLRGQLWRR